MSAAAGEPNEAPRLAQAAPAAPPSPQAGPPPGGLTRQHRSMSVEPLDQRMDMPMFQSMVQRSLPPCLVQALNGLSSCSLGHDSSSCQ